MFIMEHLDMQPLNQYMRLFGEQLAKYANVMLATSYTSVLFFSDYIYTIALLKQTPRQFIARLGLSMWTGLGLRLPHAVGSFPCPMTGLTTGWYVT